MTERLNLVSVQKELVYPAGSEVVSGLSDKELSLDELNELKVNLTNSFIEVASDLSTFGLASGHINRLVDYLWENGARSERDILVGGMHEFYVTARDVLGPLWAGYVDKVMSTASGDDVLLFAARDATPMYWAAEGLISAGREKYDLDGVSIVHVDWNRWFMGQEDETESGQLPLSFSDPMLARFYQQMGFGSGRLIKIVEPGAWGSAANALKLAMPDQPFELWFMFSHMPDRIYGYLNSNTNGIDPKYMEMINDTAEAMPKAYSRPTELVEDNGLVVADAQSKMLGSQFMEMWSLAVNAGAYAAGELYAAGREVSVQSHVEEIINLSSQSAEDIWTGVLPRNTLTWTEGENWKANWQWGKIPPLK